MDKNKMIELVKNAPEGATDYVPQEGIFFAAYINKDKGLMWLIDGSLEGGWLKNEYHNGGDLIKLDYSVLDDKPVYTKAIDDIYKSWRDMSISPSDHEKLFKEHLIKASLISGNDNLNAHIENTKKIATLNVFMAENKIGKIGESVVETVIKELSEKHGIDTRTDQEKLIDEVAEYLKEQYQDDDISGISFRVDAENLIERFNITKKA